MVPVPVLSVPVVLLVLVIGCVGVGMTVGVNALAGAVRVCPFLLNNGENP